MSTVMARIGQDARRTPIGEDGRTSFSLAVLAATAVVDDRFADLLPIAGTYLTPVRFGVAIAVVSAIREMSSGAGSIWQRHGVKLVIGLAITWLVAATVSTSANGFAGAMIGRTILFGLLLVVFSVSAVLSSIVAAEKLAAVMCAVSLPLLGVAAFESLLQTNFGGRPYLYPFRDFLGMSIWRADSWLADANFLGVIAVSLVFVLASLARLVTDWRRVMVLATLILALVVVVASGSRGAQVGLLAGVCVSAVWRFRRARLAITVAPFAAVLLIATLLSRPTAATWVENAVMEVATRDLQEQSSSSRLIIWYTSLEGRSTREWLIGSGPAQFLANRVSRFGEIEGKAQQFVEISAHSTWVEQLVEVGLFGTVSLFLCGLALLRSVPASQGFVAAAFVSVGVSYSFLSYWAAMVFLVLGIGYGVASRSSGSA